LSDQPETMRPSLISIRADLHVHTALSPCAADEMTPPAIVAAALARGLDMIAISDHNTAGNVGATQEAAQSAGGRLAVLAGMEIASAEEVHVLGLFPGLAAAEDVAAKIRGYLPVADPEYHAFFGRQPLLGADGRPRGAESACLALAIPLDLTDAVGLVHSVGGLAVAAHVDRKSFSVFSQLGFFPRDAGFDGIETSLRARRDSYRYSELADLGLPMTDSSDSHFLDQIGAAATEFLVEGPTFVELALAFAGRDGRCVKIGGGGGAVHA
jgi:PHP family Zn ribbon phosphoesterase